ncbi:MAG: hypothetical protein WD708_09775 [Kiritimatiellia bacterium]
MTAPFISLYFGLVLLAVYGFSFLKPQTALAAFRAFPRSIWPARVLVAVCLVWFALNLNQVDLGGFNVVKRLLWVAVPAGYYLITTFIPDLLALRGLCTFCLLAGNSVLIAVRWHGSPAHFSVALLVYAVLIKCMFLVVYPHLWFRGLNWLEAGTKRLKASLAAGMALAAVMIVCGVVSL